MSEKSHYFGNCSLTKTSPVSPISFPHTTEREDRERERLLLQLAVHAQPGRYARDPERVRGTDFSGKGFRGDQLESISGEMTRAIAGRQHRATHALRASPHQYRGDQVSRHPELAILGNHGHRPDDDEIAVLLGPGASNDAAFQYRDVEGVQMVFELVVVQPALRENHRNCRQILRARSTNA